MILFLIVYYFKSENYRQENLLEHKNIKLAYEKIKTDNLLLNILPFETAEELKSTGYAKTKLFNKATVLFTDFYNFTRIVEKMGPEELVFQINTYFSSLDMIVEKHNVEKIKTIGDSYMRAGGLPVENENNPLQML